MLNKATTGTIFITSLVWRGPWLGIEPGTSRTRSQQYTTRISRRRYFLESIIEALILLWKSRSHTSTQLCYFFYANIILNMLNLTFYLKHVAKQKYNSYNYVEINVVFTPNSRGIWRQFWVRPACTPVLSDQALHCWLLKFKISSRFPLNSVLRVKV